ACAMRTSSCSSGDPPDVEEEGSHVVKDLDRSPCSIFSPPSASSFVEAKPASKNHTTKDCSSAQGGICCGYGSSLRIEGVSRSHHRKGGKEGDVWRTKRSLRRVCDGHQQRSGDGPTHRAGWADHCQHRR